MDYLINHFCEVFDHSTDFSSVSEKLYHLKQGKMSIQDYSLKFRTLAAACGWNERSLLTTYCQDLNPQLRLHLATYSDTIGLERFIQTANQVSNRIRHCNEELQVTLHHQPEWESAPEPMQIGNTRLPFTKRQRRLAQGLCLYCGTAGHAILSCPICPP